MAEVIFVGLGANLGDPRSQLRKAVHLCALRFSNLRLAPLYRTQPVGPQPQPDFYNSVLEATTTLSPHQTFEALQAIERGLGRVREARWGPRLIDLDLLVYGGSSVQTPELVVPHPELHRRRFVLVPLADLAPKLLIAGQNRDVAALLADLPASDGDVVQVAEDWLSP